MKTRFLFFLAGTLLFLSMSAIAEGACWEDSLSRVDRDILVMGSGAVYRLLDDPKIITFWLPVSRLTICEQTGSADGEIVVYYEIRSADAPEVVRAVGAR